MQGYSTGPETFLQLGLFGNSTRDPATIARRSAGDLSAIQVSENALEHADNTSSDGEGERQRKRLHKSQSARINRSNESHLAETQFGASQIIPPSKASRIQRKPSVKINNLSKTVNKVTESAPSSSNAQTSHKSQYPGIDTSSVPSGYAFGEDAVFDFAPSVDLHSYRDALPEEPQLSEFPVPGAPGLLNIRNTPESRPVRNGGIPSPSPVDSLKLKQILPSGTTISARKSAAVNETMPAMLDASPRRQTSTSTHLGARLSNRSNTRETSNKSVDSSSAASVRSLKSKSLQTSLRPVDFVQNDIIATSESSSISSSTPVVSTGSQNSPNANALKGVTTSGSSKANRRMSTYGHVHVTGLGARTVSPTDTRRMKRMSIMPTTSTPSRGSQPSSPNTQSPSTTDATVFGRNVSDAKRKSVASTVSLSSSGSSARMSNNPIQSRLSQNLSISRLPTPKAKTADMEQEEYIPPVPPIPRALATEGDQPTYSVRKSSLPSYPSTPVTRSARQSMTAATASDFSPKIDPETRRKRGLTMGPTLETKVSSSSLNQKKLQPLRLPPLTVLPLSTPTVARVNALGNNKVEGEQITPIRSGQRTPSTPLTASKVNFPDNRKQINASQAPLLLRSTSSTQLAHSPSATSVRASSSNSSSMPAINGKYGRTTISPFVSSSLPKAMATGGDLSAMNQAVKSSRRPNLQILASSGRRKSKDELSSAGTQDVSPSKTPETPSSGSSIRRKLSMSWKRSSSKASHAKEERDAEYPMKHENMPPPKLPGAVTWTGSTSEDRHTSPSLKTVTRQRSTVYSSTLKGHDRTKSDSWGSASLSALTKDVERREHLANIDSARVSSRASSTLLPPAQRPLTSKSSTSSIRSSRIDISSDADDQLADEEMRKLAGKRKGLEAAAAEVEVLQARAGPKERVSAHQALRSSSLNIYERGEIVDYKDIFFTGSSDAKKIVGDLNGNIGTCNFGYDDERGDYNIVTGDHLAYRYEVIDVLGKGSFGQVVRCIDHRTGGLVAVKIIRNKKRFHQQALVEVNILQKLREWDPANKHSLVKFTQSFYFRSHLCISTELLGMNLYEFIKSNDFRGFSLRLIKRFTKQLLGSLILLKGHKVIHCDLKPENVLLAHPLHSDIKVIDFGSSCLEHEKVYTYIQSRFYRSPEVILGMTYGLPIDMWSLGCILAELYTGYPIFPGENEQEQLACIMEVFGPPEKHLIEKSSRKKLFFDSFGKPRMIVSSKGRRRRPSSKTLQQAIKCDDEAFLDFLGRCLRWDPDKRMKPDEAITHEFVTGKKPIKARLVHNMDSPVKRSGTISSVRPLPEPPAHKAGQGIAFGVGSNSSQSASSSNGSTKLVAKRHSMIAPAFGAVNGVKRSSTGITVSNSLVSGLPRVSARSSSISMQKAESSDSNSTMTARSMRS